MGGPEPIQPTEIEAWLRLHRLSLEPWEVELIEAMDTTLLEAVSVNSAKT